MTVEIMNLRRAHPSEPYDFRIDRSSPLGNPFPMSSERQRNWCCDSYADRFWHIFKHGGHPAFTQELEKVYHAYQRYGKVRLFCWCAPKRCHGETIKRWLEDPPPIIMRRTGNGRPEGNKDKRLNETVGL